MLLKTRPGLFIYLITVINELETGSSLSSLSSSSPFCLLPFYSFVGEVGVSLSHFFHLLLRVSVGRFEYGNCFFCFLCRRARVGRSVGFGGL